MVRLKSSKNIKIGGKSLSDREIVRFRVFAENKTQKRSIERIEIGDY